MKRLIALLLSIMLLWTYSALGAESAYIGPENSLVIAGQAENAVGENVSAIVFQSADAVYYTQRAGDADESQMETLWVYANGEASKLYELGSNAVCVQADGAIYFLADAGAPKLMALDTVTGQASQVADLSGAVSMENRPEIALEGDRLVLYTLSESDEKTAAGTWQAPAAGQAIAPEQSLSKGAKGEEIRSLQERLSDLGYPTGTPDGSFGYRTYAAVRYFQDALGVEQTGVVTAELKKRLFSEEAPQYSEFVALDRGSRGIRVEALQARLRALMYTTDSVDGEYGGRTAEAVRRFQRKAGLDQTGLASVETIRALMAKNAPVFSDYVALSKGDTGARVKKLKERLYKLGYYAGERDGVYNDATVGAVKRFQKAVDIKEDGTASVKLQKKLFASSAPKCRQHIELKYGDTGIRVKELQKRLKKLGYFDGTVGGHFRSKTRDAVKAFQKALGVKRTGVATVGLQKSLFASDAPAATPKPTKSPEPTPTASSEP